MGHCQCIGLLPTFLDAQTKKAEPYENQRFYARMSSTNELKERNGFGAPSGDQGLPDHGENSPPLV